MQQIADIFQDKKQDKKPVKQAPAYQWQDFALKIIKDLAVPGFKRNSVFKICKDLDKNFVEKCLDDTKELAEGREQWKYFFKLIGQKNDNNPEVQKS
ncbi:hypothetical protein HOB10_04325 [Candidatus Parcubacteria bacterium]|jgi:hypothetical protein|nr:hypothetical protein [Candidatus Parcubacteria bacterium]